MEQKYIIRPDGLRGGLDADPYKVYDRKQALTILFNYFVAEYAEGAEQAQIWADQGLEKWFERHTPRQNPVAVLRSETFNWKAYLADAGVGKHTVIRDETGNIVDVVERWIGPEELDVFAQAWASGRYYGEQFMEERVKAAFAAGLKKGHKEGLKQGRLEGYAQGESDTTQGDPEWEAWHREWCVEDEQREMYWNQQQRDAEHEKRAAVLAKGVTFEMQKEAIARGENPDGWSEWPDGYYYSACQNYRYKTGDKTVEAYGDGIPFEYCYICPACQEKEGI
jgi:hypothetical protein